MIHYIQEAVAAAQLGIKVPAQLVLGWESKSTDARWLQRRHRAVSIEGHLGDFWGTRMHADDRDKTDLGLHMMQGWAAHDAGLGCT